MTIDELRELLAQLGLEWEAKPTVFYIFFQRPDGRIDNLSVTLRGMTRRHAEGADLVRQAEGLIQGYPAMSGSTLIGFDHPNEGPTAWIDTAEACALLHTHRNTLHRWAQQGWLRCHKVGGKTYYDRRQVDRMIADHTVQDNGRLDRTGATKDPCTM